jgi:tetraacyldisaccharide 4'-kinase
LPGRLVLPAPGSPQTGDDPAQRFRFSVTQTGVDDGHADAALGVAGHIQAIWRSGRAPPLALRLLACLYGAAVATRRELYRRGWFKVGGLPVPVIVVGNRVVGGAGKTPTTLALIDAMRALGWTPGVVSRGHGRRGQAPGPVAVRVDSPAALVGDEPLLLARRARVPVWVDRDRAGAARALLQAHPDIDLLLCDDGLQHLGLGRDVELIVYDERGNGNGFLLPAGPLREPPDAPPATPDPALVVYNAAQPSTLLPGPVVERHLAAPMALAHWWQGSAADPATWAALQAGTPWLCAGIGQPGRLVAMLAQRGVAVHLQTLPDHFDFAALPWPAQAGDVIVTEKDAVKLDPARVARERPASRVWVVPLEFTLPTSLVDTIQARLAAQGYRPGQQASRRPAVLG